MTDGKPPGERPRSQWTEGVHGRLDLLRVAIEENTKATLAMSMRINSMFLVPLALAAMGVATWALFVGKISEHSWLGVLFACLAEFFGKGVRSVLEGLLPWSGKKASEAKHATTLTMVGIGAGVFLLGWVR